MNKFVVLRFANRVQADEAVVAVKKLHAEHRFHLYASALVAKDADGKLSVQEITKEGHSGTAVAALIGALAGLPVGPAAAVIMATGGAAIGDAADLIIGGDFSKFANSLNNQIAPGGAVIVAELAEDRVSAFKAAVRGMGSIAPPGG